MPWLSHQFREAARGVQVRLARVVVVDLGGEEFQDAPGGLGRRREKRRRAEARGRGEDDFGAVMALGSYRVL